jgi:CMP-N,N'-diacetyllegionaminic acid synthase
MTVACVIPARLGSKRVPKKNIREIGGKPMIAWSIDAAREVFDEVFVATEADAIASIAKEHGALVPRLLEEALCGDLVPSWKPCVALLDEEGIGAEALCCLQPTSPCRSADDILLGLERFAAADADFAVSVTEIDPHYFHWALTDEGGWHMVFGNDYLIERPLLPKRYRPNGSIKIAKRDALLREGSFFGAKLVCIDTPEERSVHVGTEFELRLAHALLDPS